MITLLVAAGAKVLDPRASVIEVPRWLPMTPSQVGAAVAALEVLVVLIDVAVGPLVGCASAAAFFLAAGAWTNLNADASDFACACFGRLSAEHGRGYVLGRNGVLFFVAILAAASSQRSSLTAWTVFAGMCLVLLLLLEELGCEGLLDNEKQRPVEQ